jgi:energy-converting hydrogenase Eha subunit E
MTEITTEANERSEERKNFTFAPNIGLVKGPSRKDIIILMLGLSLSGVFFADVFLGTKIIVGVLLAVIVYTKALAIIYASSILKNPIEIDTQKNVFMFFDEYKRKRISIDLNSIKKAKFFYKYNRPFILELKILSKGKEIEDNINIEAFDNETINYLKEILAKSNKNIDLAEKYIKSKIDPSKGLKNFKKNKQKKQS